MSESDNSTIAAGIDRGECDSCGTPLERGDLRCAICGKAAPVLNVSVSNAETIKILRCTGCGAAVAYDPEKQAPSCSFCDSVFEVETIEDPMEQTEGYLPFTVAPDEARAQLQKWLSSLGWFRPSDLSSSARVQELKPLWWVAWVFDADARISWAADSNQGSRRSAWAPHAGTTEVVFDDILASASRGLNAREVGALSSGYDLGSAKDNPENAEDATIERFDVQRSQARKQVTDALEQMARLHVKGSHTRDQIQEPACLSGVAEPGHSTLVLSSLCDGLSLSGAALPSGHQRAGQNVTFWQRTLLHGKNCWRGWGGAGNSDSCPVDGCHDTMKHVRVNQAARWVRHVTAV